MDRLAVQLTPPAPHGRPSFASLLKSHKDLSAQERKAVLARATPSETTSDTDRKVRQLCRDFFGGRGCRRTNCKYLHERPPRPACLDFKHGRCWRGLKCRYVHLARVPTLPVRVTPPGDEDNDTPAAATPPIAPSTTAEGNRPQAPAAAAPVDSAPSGALGGQVHSNAPMHKDGDETGSSGRRCSLPKRRLSGSDMELGEVLSDEVDDRGRVPKHRRLGTLTPAVPTPAAPKPATKPLAKPAAAAANSSSNSDSANDVVLAAKPTPAAAEPAGEPAAFDSGSAQAIPCLQKCGFMASSTDDMCRHTNAAHCDLLPSDTDLRGLASFVNEVMAGMRCPDGLSTDAGPSSPMKTQLWRAMRAHARAAAPTSRAQVWTPALGPSAAAWPLLPRASSSRN